MSRGAIVEIKSVSKRLSKDLRRSLWGAVQDIGRETLVRHESARPDLRPTEFWAVDNVSFAVHPGEGVGIIGDNGAGKSTLLRLIGGLIKPDSGEIKVRGRVATLIELGAGFNPILTGRENVYINAALLGMSSNRIQERFEAIVDFAGVEEFIDTPLYHYSTGMQMRLGYAIAAHVDADLLIVDEVLAVGDMDYQRKCIEHMSRYLAGGGSLLLVSHSPYHVQAACKRCIVMDHGRAVFQGTELEGVKHYLDLRIKRNEEHDLSAKTNDPGAGAVSVSKPVVIEELIVEGENGREIVSEEPVRVTLKYNSLRTIDNAYWGFSIWTEDTFICIAASINKDRVTIYQGRNEFSCRVPRFPLARGRYRVRSMIGTSTPYQVLDLRGWRRAPDCIEVGSPNADDANIQSILQTLIVLEVEWDVAGNFAAAS